MIGTMLSFADLLAYFEIQSLVILDFDFGKYKLITKWMKKMS